MILIDRAVFHREWCEYEQVSAEFNGGRLSENYGSTFCWKILKN